jgi:hypothetical protein
MDRAPEITTSASINEANMKSWYLPALPAAMALSFIAYSFWTAY